MEIRPTHLAAGVLALLLFAGQLGAQQLSGRVVGDDSVGISGAVVEVLESGQYMLTSGDGSFQLRVPTGEWRLRTTRIGYRADTTRVVVAERGTRGVRITLIASPLEVRGISARPARAPRMSATVTRETVRQVPPLGEPDVFRAVVLLPGVSQPNDLKGRIHLAGGSSDETGVRLDGHPLQDPFHLLGLFGAFNVATLERADLLVHHQPPAVGGRLSGIVDLHTRQPTADADGEAVAGLLTAGATANPSVAGFDLLASGRFTYLNHLAPLVVEDVPRLGFADATVRLGRDLGRGWRAEALGFTTRDHFRETGTTSPPDTEPFRWGESLLGLRLERAGGTWETSLRLSRNRAYVRLDEAAQEANNRIRSDRAWLAGGVEVLRRGAGWRAEAGLEVDRRVNRQAWTAAGLIDEVFSPNTPATYEGSESQTVLSGYGGIGVDLGSRSSIFAGGRLSRMAGAWFVAPRLAADLVISETISAELAVNRRYQFDAQLEEPIEGSVTAPLFLLTDPRRADMAAASFEWVPARSPVGDFSTLRLQGFLKRYPDRTRLPPRIPGQGREAGPEFPEFQRIPGHSVGGSVSGRIHLGGEGLLQGSYTYQRVREEFDGESAPTSWDAPHTLVLFGSAPLGGGFVVNAAYHAHSGRATTPVLGLTFEPDLRFPTSHHLQPRYLYGERNSIRVPPYHRLDVGVRKNGSWAHGTWTVFAQILNTLGRENAVDYDWRVYFGDLANRRAAGPRAGRGGLPFLPSLGVEVRW